MNTRSTPRNAVRGAGCGVTVRATSFVGELVRGRPGAHRDDRGATSVEYALMVSLIAVVIIAAVTLFGQNMVHLFNVPAAAL
ncbi:Flp family type IVb pilin [Pedococcus sp. KACC 23699]|uniref:Flp family type IVb pilin n=1 Tax=Pedococcus sp. KACC 23699 TaxID=3149228 RepID=A0AAU7JV26_9MICO